jgi:hypothetical protein
MPDFIAFGPCRDQPFGNWFNLTMSIQTTQDAAIYHYQRSDTRAGTVVNGIIQTYTSDTFTSVLLQTSLNGNGRTWSLLVTSSGFSHVGWQ